MGRKAEIRYWQRKGGGYFCVYRGTRHELALGPDDRPSGPTYLKALAKFQEILGKPLVPQERLPLLVEVFDEYLTHIKKSRKPGTVRMREQTIIPFCNHGFAMKPLESLTHMDVY